MEIIKYGFENLIFSILCFGNDIITIEEIELREFFRLGGS